MLPYMKGQNKPREFYRFGMTSKDMREAELRQEILELDEEAKSYHEQQRNDPRFKNSSYYRIYDINRAQLANRIRWNPYIQANKATLARMQLNAPKPLVQNKPKPYTPATMPRVSDTPQSGQAFNGLYGKGNGWQGRYNGRISAGGQSVL